MYAVIQTGGKQYKVAEGAMLKVEKIEKGIGETVEFDQVLMLSTGDELKVGSPHVKGAKVVAEVIEQARDKKVKIIKFRRRKHHMKQQGHRQYYTALKIKSIKA
ncbi:50S ribosomal protein L21 [Thiotrichales bacterium 19S11-10]|nr:50S ribosomal protein L21 [Thiotrichales bacterium 19S11-10]MCF6807442.1 50S ribosomal protein L21 [Thiotrichales bacterium 19S9-11]MCF6811411.1 50S ribosomal protein L21 [Thiotrichales bacterium 19S9-12]